MHLGDVDRLAMGLAGAEHVLETNADAGVDTALPAAVVDLFRRGVEAGHSTDSFSALVELMAKPGSSRNMRQGAGLRPWGICDALLVQTYCAGVPGSLAFSWRRALFGSARLIYSLTHSHVR